MTQIKRRSAPLVLPKGADHEVAHAAVELHEQNNKTADLLKETAKAEMFAAELRCGQCCRSVDLSSSKHD